MSAVKAHPDFYCDTTIAFGKLDGHTLQRQSIRSLSAGRRLYHSTFMRHEYIRARVIPLIELYLAVDIEGSIANGIEEFCSQYLGKHRTIQNALKTANKMQEKCDGSGRVPLQVFLSRLGATIVSILADFDDEFIHRVRDPLQCQLGELRFAHEPADKSTLLKFSEDFRRIRHAPACQQCVFRRNTIAMIQGKGIDLVSDAQVAAHPECAGFAVQARNLKKAETTSLKGPSCHYCEMLGDSIVALSMPDDLELFTSDGNSFPALCTILSKKLTLAPSYKTLKNQNTASITANRLRRKKK